MFNNKQKFITIGLLFIHSSIIYFREHKYLISRSTDKETYLKQILIN